MIYGNYMDARNIEHFMAENPGAQFPHHRSLSINETEGIRRRLKKLIGLPDATDDLALVREVAKRSKECEGVNVNDAEFNISTILEHLNISPNEKLYINFYRFDIVDEMSINDISRHFNFIWYAGSDDIDIFDESLHWIFSISHDGHAQLLNLTG
jgi:hypothetical protein